MSSGAFDLSFKSLQPLSDTACSLLWRSVGVLISPSCKPISYGCVVILVTSVMPRNGQVNTIEDFIWMKDNGISSISSFLNYCMVGFCPRDDMMRLLARGGFAKPCSVVSDLRI